MKGPILHYVVADYKDGIGQIKFDLRPDIWSDLEDQFEFWTDRMLVVT